MLDAEFQYQVFQFFYVLAEYTGRGMEEKTIV